MPFLCITLSAELPDFLSETKQNEKKESEYDVSAN